jgi:hypothetical protein
MDNLTEKQTSPPIQLKRSSIIMETKLDIFQLMEVRSSKKLCHHERGDKCIKNAKRGGRPK